MNNNNYSIGPLIWSGIKGLCLSEDEKKYLQKFKISGVILFKRNIESLKQLFELCKEIHSLKPAPLIVLDREGGPVDRLKHLPEFPAWPSPEKMTKVCSLEEIKKTGYYMGSEMKALGMSVNFAPLCGCAFRGKSSVPGKTFRSGLSERNSKRLGLSSRLAEGGHSGLR